MLNDLNPEKKEVLNNKIKPHFNENRMGYIKVPTGWGKTFLAKHIMKEYYENGKAVLFVTSMNVQLLEQTAYDINSKIKLFQNSLVLSSKDEKISIEDLIEKITNRKFGIVIFASLQTINSEKNKAVLDFLQKNIDLVIIDEIHNFIKNKGNEFIDAIYKLNVNTKIFGMTATPFQGVIGNVKFVEDISGDMFEIYSKTLPQCIMEGQLSELSYTIIRNNQSILDVFDFENGLDALNQDLFINCGTKEKINSVIRRTYLAKKIFDDKICTKNSKTLIFCSPVRNIIHSFDDDQERVNAFHAKLCSAIFNNEIKEKFDPTVSFNNYSESGQIKNAVYLSSELKKEEQNDIIMAFKETNKPPFILCSVGMLVEGFDFPELENLILLRPTLSMRLFEQQIGRLTRKSPNKDRGNIFEIVDDIESLYDMFGENVFNEKNLERIQMLEPENRIEELFTEGNNIEAIVSNKIEITDINFNGLVDGFEKNSVQIPPISLRTKYFSKLLSFIEKKYEGAFEREKIKIIEMVLGFKIYHLDDAKEISNLYSLLEKLEKEAYEDPRLSGNCRKNKPKILHEVKWLLKLRALTFLKINNNLSDMDKLEILEILGFEKNIDKIDEFRKDCLEKGTKTSVMGLCKKMKNIIKIQKTKLFQMRIIKNQIKTSSSIYWASCFTDDPEIKELFESKDWNYNVKKYVIK